MKLQKIRTRLHKKVRDIDAQLERFQQERPGGDGDEFLSYLYHQDLLDSRAYAELHSMAGVEAARTIEFRRQTEPESPTKQISRLDQVNAKLARLLVERDWADEKWLAKLLEQLAKHNRDETENPKMLARVLLKKTELDRAKLDQAIEALGPLPACAWCGGPPPKPATRYLQLGELTKGRNATTHLAKDPELGRKVAYKSLDEAHRDDEAACQAFLTEAQITSQLDHPAIPPIYALESRAGELSYSMKLIRGTTLKAWIGQIDAAYRVGEGLDTEQQLGSRLERFLKICDAVHYAHEKKVLHRDLKPSNVMIGPHGEVYVMDWGLSMIIGDDMEHASTAEIGSDELDGTGSATVHDLRGPDFGGTPAYMSPEQVAGRPDELDGRSDQYALGAILYELVTTQRAVPGDTPQAVLQNVRDGNRAPFVHPHGESLAPELGAIVDKAMAREPGDRYGSVKALAEDVRRHLRGEAVAARPDNWKQGLMRWVGQHREASLAAGLLLMLLGAIATVLGLDSRYDAIHERNVALQEQLALKGDLDRERKARRLAQSRAAAQAQLIGEFAATVGQQSQQLDSRLREYESLLVALATSARTALLHSKPGERQPLYFAEDFTDPRKRPRDVRFSPRYNRPISIEEPAIALAPGVERSVVEPQLQQLAFCRKLLRGLMLESYAADWQVIKPADQVELLRKKGTPLMRAYVGLESGVHVEFPGRTGFSEAFDPRKQSWYVDSWDTHGPIWGLPVSSPTGRLLPCTATIRNDSGELVGVAGVELALDYLIRELMLIPGIEPIECLLISRDGKLLVRSNEVGLTSRADDATIQAALAEVAKDRPTGVTTTRPQGGSAKVIALSRMQSVVWYYVVIAERKKVLFED